MYKLLYLTDNREQYAQGYYYVDWLEAFQGICDVTVFGAGYSTALSEVPAPDELDLVVYGHAFIDIWFHTKDPWFSSKKFNGLDVNPYRKIPSILFSKNEYKLMEERIEFCRTLEDCLLVIYGKETLEKYKSKYQNIYWIPFGINPNRFRAESEWSNVREINIGMRGNRHKSYIGQLRESVGDAINRELGFLNLDVKLSEDGEDFLLGQEYVNWIRNSKMTANTVSALNIVNPKFYEIMASGSLIIAPAGDYEGLLKKDQHFIDYQNVLELKDKQAFGDFYEAKKEAILPEAKKTLEFFNYPNFARLVTRKLFEKFESDKIVDFK